jgi:DNA-directed RNA polymerase specialized sigma24 family protein
MIHGPRADRLAKAQRAYGDTRDRVWIDRIGAGLAHRRALREIDDRVGAAREKRDAAVLEAVEAGGSYREVARALGLSHGRVQQIVNAHRDSPVR